MIKAKLPRLPNGERWSDYIELEYAVANPCRWPRKGGMAGSDVLRFFMRMESGKVLIVDGTEYIRKAAWWSRFSKVRTLMATLSKIAEGAGHSPHRARVLVKAWAAFQIVAPEGLRGIVNSKRYDEHFFPLILRSFLNFINEAARAERT